MMTDRVKTLTVHLTHDIRTDDMEPVVEAIKQLRFVEKVEVNVLGAEDSFAVTRAKRELSAAIWKVLQ
jgi:hypothetical protein